MAVSFRGFMSRAGLISALLVSLLLVTAMPVSAATTEYSSVIGTAKAQIGDPWKHYAKGPDKFDCVGFVWFAFHQNDLQSHIGGYRGVGGYLSWFRERGLVTTDQSKAVPGDLIIWGANKHIGIYLGDGMAISALVNPYGVKIHPVKGYIGMKVKAYLRTKLAR